jgi:hypothetical protein
MSVIATLAGVNITSSEQQTVAAAVVNGEAFGDAAGTVQACLNSLNQIKMQLTNLAAAMPAGTNKTNINTVITNLA